MASSPHYNHGLLWRAITLSLLLHVVVLLLPGFGAASSPPLAAQVLSALLQPRVDNPSREVPAPASHAAHQPALLREATPAAHSVTVPATSTPQTVAEVASAAKENQNAANDGNSNSAGTAIGSGSDGPDFAENEKSYRFAIVAEARRVKKYPPHAFAAGWIGTAEIHVIVNAGGTVRAPQLQKSSGYSDIDNAALSFVAIALRRVPVPENLRAHDFDFVLPVSFIINDE